MTDTQPSFHMSPDEFRRHGRAVIDWIADYYERVESFPVLSQVVPGQIRASLPPGPPEQGESFETMLHDVEELLLPGITHWQSPNFFGFFPANASAPAILGELLSAGLGVQGSGVLGRADGEPRHRGLGAQDVALHAHRRPGGLG